MAMEVYGPFPTTYETVKKVNGLQLKGLTAKNITIFADNKNAIKLKNHTAVKVETDLSRDENEDSFMDKVKKVFVDDEGDNNPNLHDKLVDIGISESRSSEYEEDIDAGEILVVADNTLKLGHDQFFDKEDDGQLSVRRNI